ncbi:hypothetical protein AB0911_38570 [Streptomyces nigra]|uniref:hypothetical protein n=1 Tax=Streptomyces nigra TaxID=1827580 RepID=UPI00345293F3
MPSHDDVDSLEAKTRTIPLRPVVDFELPSTQYDSVIALRAAIATKLGEATGGERQVTVSFAEGEISTNKVISMLLHLSAARYMTALLAYSENVHAEFLAQMPAYMLESHTKKSTFLESGFQAYENKMISEMAAALRIPEELLHSAHVRVCKEIADTDGSNAIPGYGQTPTKAPADVPEVAREVIPTFTPNLVAGRVRIKSSTQIFTAALYLTATVKKVWAENHSTDQSELTPSSTSGSRERQFITHAAVLGQDAYQSQPHRGQGADKTQSELSASEGQCQIWPVPVRSPRR